MMKLGKTLINILKKHWWVLLLPLLFFIPLDKVKSLVKSIGGYSTKVDKYLSIAETLYSAMAAPGTDEYLMFTILKPLNGDELVKVYDAFGNKGYALGGAFFGGYSLDLFGWFNKELSREEKTQMRNIWAKSGLSLSF
ncbi:hypothetical protein KEM09_12110 [Carboxylicivirga mesophila]|uniref:DUF4359 domain-containing protein n=1 Tax=Carboxylicivirga mesophila TaxID=1166478 RepID=A0ABS5KAU6_9BACT|nr:hypothetical protein [Carboxylicivirga mesophila]MBS2212154.1 hypothetical protein [Carboxylicivirga mesophila]